MFSMVYDTELSLFSCWAILSNLLPHPIVSYVQPLNVDAPVANLH